MRTQVVRLTTEERMLVAFYRLAGPVAKGLAVLPLVQDFTERTPPPRAGFYTREFKRLRLGTSVERFLAFRRTAAQRAISGALNNRAAGG